MSARERVRRRTHYLDTTGVVWAIEPSGIRFPLYNVSGIHEDYRNIAAGAPMLFRVMDAAIPTIGTMVDILETFDMDAEAFEMIQLQNNMNVAVRAASEGVENILKRRR